MKFRVVGGLVALVALVAWQVIRLAAIWRTDPANAALQTFLVASIVVVGVAGLLAALVFRARRSAARRALLPAGSIWLADVVVARSDLETANPELATSDWDEAADYVLAATNSQLVISSDAVASLVAFDLGSFEVAVRPVGVDGEHAVVIVGNGVEVAMTLANRTGARASEAQVRDLADRLSATARS